VARDGWLEGVAVIRESHRIGREEANQGEPWPWEISLNVIGSRRYDLTLEVTAPGAEPYLVSGRFKVPKKAENVGFFSAGNKIPAGVELPVRVHPGDRQKIEIEWERWRTSPGHKAAMRAGRAKTDAAYMRDHLTKHPKLQAKLRANNQIAAMAWVEAVRLGNLTREQFDQQLALEVEHGRMDPADADAARGTLDGV
jgi:hypothetical protein